MPKAPVRSVDEYITSQPPHVQDALKRIRGAIRTAAPRATESISYGMPAYALSGAHVLQFGAWKRHFALYGATQRVVTAFKDELSAFEVGNGTIRFPISEPAPVKLIARIVKLRASEIVERRVTSER